MPAVSERPKQNLARRNTKSAKGRQSAQTTPFYLGVNFRALTVEREKFFRFCMDNKNLRIELSAQGELTITPPTGGETGRKNGKLNVRLGIWAEQDGKGEYFDSSTEFELPNGAFRSPDASWILKERYYALAPAERKKFPPICPDFVVELRSETDRLPPLKEKMAEYIANGARLGWLIDPGKRQVYVYRPRAEVEILHNPATVSGEDVLPGFVLQLAEIW
jgi:Uma2 family endonuclease